MSIFGTKYSFEEAEVTLHEEGLCIKFESLLLLTCIFLIDIGLSEPLLAVSVWGAECVLWADFLCLIFVLLLLSLFSDVRL